MVSNIHCVIDPSKPTFSYFRENKHNTSFNCQAIKNTSLYLWSVGHLPQPDIFPRSLYTLDIGQNDFTSNLATIGIAGVKQYLPEVVSEIITAVKVISY